MKVFIALFACVVIASAAFTKKSPEDLLRFRKECDAPDNLNIPQELQEKYSKFEYPDDELTHKHIKCVALKFETWNENDGYVPDLMLQQFGDDKKPILEKCLTKRNPDWTAEKWAWNDWKCLVQNGISK
ncbi:general odorant-binding protein 99b-like [Condylostylus longicornis]|uniref:general odorant-binding protein 99b-like n=1 Tax=Condylostylus longicornis TaxID=2530218 RepID=UPI00244E0110|nr:general odorant-binding protein 99b-like [Condylostylus longicornis]